MVDTYGNGQTEFHRDKESTSKQWSIKDEEHMRTFWAMIFSLDVGFDVEDMAAGGRGVL